MDATGAGCIPTGTNSGAAFRNSSPISQGNCQPFPARVTRIRPGIFRIPKGATLIQLASISRSERILGSAGGGGAGLRNSSPISQDNRLARVASVTAIRPGMERMASGATSKVAASTSISAGGNISFGEGFREWAVSAGGTRLWGSIHLNVESGSGEIAVSLLPWALPSMKRCTRASGCAMNASTEPSNRIWDSSGARWARAPSMITRSATLRTVRISCVTRIAVIPKSLRTLRIRSLIMSVMIGSRPVVGSSKSINSGLSARALANPTRFLMPPDSSAGNLSATPGASPTSPSILRMIGRISFSGRIP